MFILVAGEKQTTEFRVRAKQSITASGMQSCFGVSVPHPKNHAAPSRLHRRGMADIKTTSLRELLSVAPSRSRSLPTSNQQEGLHHDARNLVGTIGLYCDLLSMPGVLKPEHRQYPEELRLLGARSKSLIDHLMQSLFALESETGPLAGTPEAEVTGLPARQGVRTRKFGGSPENAAKHVSLRSVVERCSGLLKRVANGRVLEITYGPAATIPVRVPEEAVERILTNLVRNAAVALGGNTPMNDRPGGETSENSPAAIRILVGPMISRVGEHKP